MTDSWQITDEDVLNVLEQLADPSESLSTREIADALDCARRTAYERLSGLADDGRLNTKKVGSQVRIWWFPTDNDDADISDAEESPLPKLTSDHVLEFEFYSEQLAQAFLEAGGSNVQITVDGIVPLDDGSQLQYWTITGIPLKTYTEMVTDRPTVHDIRLLRSVEDTFRVEARTTADSLFAAFDAIDGHTKEAYLDDGMLKVVGEFPVAVDENTVIQAVQDWYLDLELLEQRLVYTPRLFRTLAEEHLTERQLTAFRLAYYAGYFDRPRESSGDDLAERMGIARQTFHHHLREAQRVIAHLLLEGLDEERNEVVHGGGGDRSDQ